MAPLESGPDGVWILGVDVPVPGAYTSRMEVIMWAGIGAMIAIVVTAVYDFAKHEREMYRQRHYKCYQGRESNG